MQHDAAVAGFDFEFTYTDQQRPYVEACIRAAKARARTLHCTWRTQWVSGTVRRCVIDGQTRRLDLLCQALYADLPSVCEGVTGRLTPKRARALGMGFVELMVRGRDVNLGEGVQRLREMADTTLYYAYFELTGGARLSEHLTARLRVTEDVIMEYTLGRYPAVVFLEEMHTAFEHVLREALGMERGDWPALRKAATKAGLLGTRDDEWPFVTGHNHTDAELLGEFNTRRRDARHSAKAADEQWIGEHGECVCLLLERFIDRWSRTAAD